MIDNFMTLLERVCYLQIVKPFLLYVAFKMPKSWFNYQIICRENRWVFTCFSLILALLDERKEPLGFEGPVSYVSVTIFLSFYTWDLFLFLYSSENIFMK